MVAALYGAIGRLVVNCEVFSSAETFRSCDCKKDLYSAYGLVWIDYVFLAIDLLSVKLVGGTTSVSCRKVSFYVGRY